MSKVLSAFAVVAAIFVPVLGPALAPVIGSAFASVGVGLTWGVASGIGSAIGAAGALGLSGASSRLARNRARSRLADLDRMAANVAADAPRKAVFGRTVMACDVRYIEPSSDSEQRYVDAIIHLASHRVTSIQEMRIGDRVAWTSSGGVASEFSGFLTVSPILEGGPSAYHVVNDGSRWGAPQRLTGCASVRIRVDRQSTKRAASPFSAGIPAQMGFIGEGMPVYDPRRDSTVPGGSGPHRANDQSTWQYTAGSTTLGDNPALVALAYLLGWRIGGKVSVGIGLPPSRLDMPAFAAAANICDEPVALAGGGTQRRYTVSGLVPDNMEEEAFLEEIAKSVNGWFDDSTGKLGLFCAVNDLSGPLVSITDDDILDGFSWDPFPAIEERYNVVRGTYLEPQMPANYQMISFPEIRISSVDGIDRPLTVAYPLVTDSRRAQRLAKQALQRAQYRGEFRARVGVRGWQLVRGQPVTVSFLPLGWTDKLFRVQTVSFNPDASVDLGLIEEHASIYAWAAEEAPMPTPAVPVKYDPRNNPFLITSGPQIGVDDGATRNVFRGAWSGLGVGTDFAANDEVLDQDAIWAATATHTKTLSNGPPTLPTTSNATWQLKLQAGAGAPGVVVVPVLIYRRAATSPALPSATVTVTLATGAVSGLTGGWTSSVPAPDGNPVWVAQAAATGLATDTTDTIPPSEWVGPTLLARDGEDGLTLSVVPSAVAVRANSAGVPLSGELPRTLSATLYDGATDVTSSATWSVSATGCVVSGSGATRSLDSLTAESASVTFTGTYSGRSAAFRVPIAVLRSGNSANRVVDTSILAPSLSTYSGEQGGPVTLAVRDATITASARVTYQGTSSAVTLAGRIVYRETPGSGPWTVVGSEHVDPVGSASPGEPSTMTFSRTLSGPTSPLNWEFGLQLRNHTGSGASIGEGEFEVTSE